MSLIQELTPINLIEERDKFFSKNCKYDPQFKYQNLITLQKREKYGRPKPEYLKLAEKILDKAFAQNTEKELRALEGPKINKEQGLKMVSHFLEKNNLEEKVEVKWIRNHISKASHYKGILKLRKDFDFREKKFLATLYHELGTHALRRHNYEQQPFYRKKTQHGFKEYLPTEEGLASFHSLLARSFQLDYYRALIYKAADAALKGSFVDTFNFVDQYLEDKKRSWRLTVKFKRGMYDTSKPGGFTKSIVYLEGLVEVWRYLKKTNFDVEGLYYGKIAAKDVAKAKELNPEFQPHLPHFYTQNPEEYQQQITHIAKLNYLDTVISDS